MLKDKNHGLGFVTSKDGSVHLAVASYDKSRLIAVPMNAAEALSLISAAEAAFLPPQKPDEDWFTRLLNLIRGR